MKKTTTKHLLKSVCQIMTTISNHSQPSKFPDLPENYLKCFDSKELKSCSEGSKDKIRVMNKGEEKTCSQKDLRQHIEPWLTALFQSEHLSLLAGSGLSYAVQDIANKNENAESRLPVTKIKEETWGCLNRYLPKGGEKSGSQGLEKRIRDASELINALGVLARRRCEDLDCQDTDSEKRNRFQDMLEKYQEALGSVMQELAQNVLNGERTLKQAPDKGAEEAFKYLVRFLMSFASRTGTRDRLHIFTTNYDRFIEAGADLAGLRLLDRFIGGIAPIFRSSRLDVDMHYNPPGIRGEPRYVEGVAKFTKLHGSLDWVETRTAQQKCESSENIIRMGVPFGASCIDPYLKDAGGGDDNRVMIYPNSSKDRETAEYPYVDLFRDFAAAICRPNHTLVCYGYGFGDKHINRVINDMLTISSTHLVVISQQLCERRRDKWTGNPQVTYLAGPDLADLKKLSDNYLPKPAIDVNTRKMVELLKNRMFAVEGKQVGDTTNSIEGQS